MQIFRRLTRYRGAIDFTQFEEPIRAELFGPESMEGYARELAACRTALADFSRLDRVAGDA